MGEITIRQPHVGKRLVVRERDSTQGVPRAFVHMNKKGDMHISSIFCQRPRFTARCHVEVPTVLPASSDPFQRHFDRSVQGICMCFLTD